MARKYDLVAIDLDGTLLDHSGSVDARNLEALRRAREAGMIVTVCTGRALIESMPIIRAIEQTGPVVVSGGAMVADPTTGKTLERFAMERELVREMVQYLGAHDHAALVLKDPSATDYDYLVIGPGGAESLDPSSRWWFNKMGVRVRYATHLDDDEHHEHTVRVGAYQTNKPFDELAGKLRQEFGPRATLQHFHGALLPKERRDLGIQSVHIVEMFHARADKWQAIERLCARLHIDPKRTAAIGDQLNDMEMITHAGLGVAMGNAHERIKAVAKRTTGACDEAGVATAIEHMLAGEW